AQLYRAASNGSSFDWLPIQSSAILTLGASDISTATNLVTVSFPLRLLNKNYTSLVLGAGDYAVVVSTVNATADVEVYSMAPPLPTAPAFIGYQGQTDNSTNDGNLNFASAGGIATGIVQVPLVRPNFGNARALLAVKETAPMLVGVAYPNPANTIVHIPFGLQQAGSLQLSLSNSLGQVVCYKDLGIVGAGNMQNATLSTKQLPEGLYFYCIATGNSKETGSLVIKH
ncbi:MAG: T9SS type A sorting domain-containing protein, partial [Chitinophagaceae bacterium]